MLISRLHSAVYNLISYNQSLWLEIRDALGGEQLFAYGYELDEEGVTSNYHILMNNRANFNE